MKTTVLSLCLLLGLVLGCDAQKQNNQKLQNEARQLKVKPEGSWQVNKEFDEFGNLIKYDSVYVWSSARSTIGSQIDMDSILNQFNSELDSKLYPFNRQFTPFLNDSLFGPSQLMKDFFQNDLFTGRHNIEDIRRKLEERRLRILKNGVIGIPEEQKRPL